MKRMGWVLVAACVFVTPALADGAAPAAPQAMKPALLVIDVQNDYIPLMAPDDMRFAPLAINGAIWLFRSHGFPVIRVYHSDLSWGPAPDSEGFRFPETIQVRPDDPQIVKHYPSAFRETQLEQLLRDKGVNTVFLCGLSATGCVLASYYGAMERGYDVFMVKSGLISPKSEHTAVVESFTESVSFDALKAILDTAQAAATTSGQR